MRTLPGAFFPRADPEELFRRARYHVTDTRLDPKVSNPSGDPTKFSKIGKGDKVEVRVGVETRADRKMVAIVFVLKEVKILQKAQADGKKPGNSLRLVGSLPVNSVDIIPTI